MVPVTDSRIEVVEHDFRIVVRALSVILDFLPVDDVRHLEVGGRSLRNVANDHSVAGLRFLRQHNQVGELFVAGVLDDVLDMELSSGIEEPVVIVVLARGSRNKATKRKDNNRRFALRFRFLLTYLGSTS